MKRSYLKKLSAVVGVFIICFNLNAQDFRMGKVSIEELQEKEHPLEPSASAAILNKAGKTYFILDGSGRWLMITETEVRIKIYNKDGVEWATHELSYYTGSRKMSAYYNSAATYNLVDGKVEKTNVKSDGKFKDEVVDDITVKKITMPDVRDGSVIEYKYTVKKPFISAFKDWHFQYSIPVNNITYEVSIPSCFTYTRHMSGYVDKVSISDMKMVRGNTMYNDAMVTYSGKDIKSIKEEPYVDNIDNYRSTLRQELAAVRYEGEKPYFFATTWPDVAKEIYEQKEFGDELKKKNYFKDDLEALLKGAVSDKDKIDVVFRYVQQRMQWNEDCDIFCDKGVKKAYDDRTGNVAEINLMLTAMLRYAGLKAHPILASTRENGVALYPGRMGFNYVLVGVKDGENDVLLDATCKNSLPGILPERILNWTGRLIRENGSNDLITLVPQSASQNVTMLTSSIDAEGKISGKIRKQYYHQFALEFREKRKGQEKVNRTEAIENEFDILVDNYDLVQIDDLTKPVTEEFDFSSQKGVEIIGDRMYISPLLFMKKEENPFKQEKREFPIYFMHPRQLKSVFMIAIPEGYEVESMPKSLAIAMEEEIGDFRYNIGVSGKNIQIAVLTRINYANINRDYYPTLRDFYSKMMEKENEKIVLKRI